MSLLVRASLSILIALILAACSAPAPLVAPAVRPDTTSNEDSPELLENLAEESIGQVLPTVSPVPDSDAINVRDLPIGQPGDYVNVTFGYRLQYPQDWYTRFGNRPVLVSFSNLNPGVYNRVSMRGEGCLVEIHAGVDVYGLSLENMMAQTPKAFAGAEPVPLGGLPAIRIPRSSPGNTFAGEWIYTEHDGRLISVSVEYALLAADVCRPAWEEMLASWQWFDPDFIVYRNAEYGYAIGYPRSWYAFNGQEDGITLSSQDPVQAGGIPELASQGMLVHTTVFENPQDLPLKDWIVQNEGDFDLSNDIELELLLGVRVIRNEPNRDLQEMTGYFQGPQGRVYLVTCIYPRSRQWEFRPVANAILYSFTF